MSKPWMRVVGMVLLVSLAAGGAWAQQPGKSAQKATPAKGQAAKPQAPAAPLDGFDAFVAEVMKEWKVPGLAIGIVQDGKMIHAKGYGLRDVEKNLPVTSKTLFAIGSITKSFTVTLLGMLTEEGKFDWDKPVRDYLPDFRLHDAVATEHMTPRDLVTHRSGLPRHDLLWYGSTLTRRQMYERLRYLEPSRDFRSAYQYQNLMFMTAGYLAEQLTGRKWEELVRERIFAPLGMTESNFSVNDLQGAADSSRGYLKVKEEVKLVPYRNIDEMGPAGSINSNVEEMSRYLLLHLNKGKVGEKQLVAAAQLEQMQTPQMTIPGQIQFDELGHAAYGMGFVVTSYRGHKLVTHGGGIDGFISLLSFLPRKNIGVIILTNLSGNNPVNNILTRNIFDRLLGLEPVNWVARVKEQEQKARQAEEEAQKKAVAARKEGTRPSHPLADYAGEFEHPAYGTLKLTVHSEQLRLDYKGFSLPLQHYHYDIFEVSEDRPEIPLNKMKVQFLMNLQGDVDRVAIPLETGVKEIVLTRKAAQEMMQRAFLEKLVGQYVLGQMTATIELQGESKLTLTVPGQPTYELVPFKDTTFQIKGLAGFSVEFRRDASGAVTEAVFHQPNGTFVAQRKQ